MPMFTESIEAKESNSVCSLCHKHSLVASLGIHHILYMKHSDVINAKSRSEWEALILEWVHNERDRMLLKRHLLDGITLELLAEEFDLSTVQCQYRVALAKNQLFKHI